MKFLRLYIITISGILIGAVGGFLYYHFVGCASGKCAITSRPLNSTIYGAIMGGLLFSSLQKEKPKTDIHKITKQ